MFDFLLRNLIFFLFDFYTMFTGTLLSSGQALWRGTYSSFYQIDNFKLWYLDILDSWFAHFVQGMVGLAVVVYLVLNLQLGHQEIITR